jgi:hypothetical protein
MDKVTVDGKKLDPLTPQMTVSGIGRDGKRFKRAADPMEMPDADMAAQKVVPRRYVRDMPVGMPKPKGN